MPYHPRYSTPTLTLRLESAVDPIKVLAQAFGRRYSVDLENEFHTTKGGLRVGIPVIGVRTRRRRRIRLLFRLD
jgi:hypothetical protein